MTDVPSCAAALGRAAALAGPDAAVRSVRPLAGGSHARTWLIRTAGPESQVILREFPPGDGAAGREARVLTALVGLGGLAPKLLASGADGGPGEWSWVLISRLPGVADITPRQPAAAAAQPGRALARIHATPPRRLAGLPSVWQRPGGSPARASGSAAGLVTAGWDRLAEAPAGLTHSDFWSGNVVWDDDVLTGVVDWTGGATGPRGLDAA